MSDLQITELHAFWLRRFLRPCDTLTVTPHAAESFSALADLQMHSLVGPDYFERVNYRTTMGGAFALRDFERRAAKEINLTTSPDSRKETTRPI